MRKFNVVVDGKQYEVEIEEVGAESVSAAPAAPVAAPAAAPAKKPVGGGTPVTAPMEGLVLSLSHKDGDAVKLNGKILVLEAMKMENDINANADGVITYAVKAGDKVSAGAVLAYIK